MNRPLTVGLTGPTGAGKSTLHGLFVQYGCEVIDCDRTAREITAPGSPALAELAEVFGRDVIAPDGTLIRPLLAERAFATPEGRLALDSITHPRVLELVNTRAADIRARGHHAIIDAPLLFESGSDALCDITVAVIAPDAVREARIMQRDGLTREAARLRMSAQQADEYYTTRADYVLVNDGSERQLIDRARKLLEPLLDCAESH